MKRLDVRFTGPIDRSMARRFRRRFSKGTVVATLSAVALYAAAATEPNLSGIWIDADDPSVEYEITHIGRKVTSVFGDISASRSDIIRSFKRGDLSFSAKQTDIRTLDGMIELRWPKSTINDCGYPDNTKSLELRLTVSADFKTLFGWYVHDRVRITYNRFGPNSCTPIQPSTETKRLVRKY